MIEASLLAPWIFFIFMSVMDFGFYSYAMIATENAARAAALYAGYAGSAAKANAVCRYALGELRSMPNVAPTLTACATTPSGLSDTTPVATALTVLPGAGPDNYNATQVVVTYRTIQLVTLPWLPGRMTIQRSVTTRY